MKRNKIYEKPEAQIDAKQFFIFCEGEKRETQYFYFFKRLATQIVLQIVPGENSESAPMKLFENAKRAFRAAPGKTSPEYDLLPGDEVWFIIDTDAWKTQITKLRAEVAKEENWFVAQSNPCFEVWLYYHFQSQKPQEEVENWKTFLAQTVKGGFDCRKHPNLVAGAIAAAEANFSATADEPDLATTEVFRLTQSFMPLIVDKLESLFPNGS